MKCFDTVLSFRTSECVPPPSESTSFCDNACGTSSGEASKAAHPKAFSFKSRRHFKVERPEPGTCTKGDKKQAQGNPITALNTKSFDVPKGLPKRDNVVAKGIAKVERFWGTFNCGKVSQPREPKGTQIKGTQKGTQKEPKREPKGNPRGKPKGTQREPKGNPKGTQREPKREPKGNPKGTQREPKGNPKGTQKGTQREPKGNRKGTQREPKGNPKGTQREPKGNPKGRERRRRSKTKNGGGSQNKRRGGGLTRC